MAGHSVIAFERWGSRRSSPRRDLSGRHRTLSVLSVRSAESVWITSSSSANGTCTACYRAIFNTTMTPERIFRSPRSVRGRAPYNLPRPAISLPFQKSAVCTIAMSVEQLRPHVPARTRPTFNCRHDNFQILSKDSFGADDAAIRKHASELATLAPDVILAQNSTAVAALLQATRTVPIVFAIVADPVGAGFVDSLARPGGNATGFSLYEYDIGGKWLELLKEIRPSITRVAVI